MLEKIARAGKEEMEKMINKEFIELLRVSKPAIECPTPKRLVEATQKIFELIFGDKIEWLPGKIEVGTGITAHVMFNFFIYGKTTYKIEYTATWEKDRDSDCYKFEGLTVCNNTTCLVLDYTMGLVIYDKHDDMDDEDY